MNSQPQTSDTRHTPLEERFRRAAENLGSSRRELVREILDNPDETYFLSSRAMAKRYGVDAATIVRTVQALGYEKYQEFAADLRAHFVSRITPYTLMKAAAKEKRSISDHVAHSLEIELQNLESLRSTLSSASVIEIAKVVDRCRRIVIVGVDFAYSLSTHLEYGLVSLGYDAEAPMGSTGNLHQKVNLLTPKDLLIGISFGRCLRATVESVLLAKERGVFTFGITDSNDTPIARHCDSHLVARIANPSFHGSYVAPLAAIDALLVACSHLHPQRSIHVLQHKDREFRTGNRWYDPELPEDQEIRSVKENGDARPRNTKNKK
ncbi:MAG TPA: MurR/RpiR family transcriptional regulator [Terriglobales bacterium]|jgi:DNA-binding MurR/RpiR family transcriptional regulator